MDRRKFFKNGSLFTIGTALINPLSGVANTLNPDFINKNKKAKNIIFMVSDGMSSGTLNMAHLFLERKTGKGSNWIQLYKDNRITRSVMDTASANSIVTDSAAGSSSWGCGFRVNNGSLNVGPNGETYLPILQKFKKSGKKVGCVTTVPVTHATPAGFSVNAKKRNDQSDIAKQYLDLNFDLFLGGGSDYFRAETRKDKRNLFTEFEQKGYQVAVNKNQLLQTKNNKPLLGIFAGDALPYNIDRLQSENLTNSTPSLAEMTQKAIDNLKDHKNGFVIQVEGGKVDWAAHANDIGALIHEQISFDEAIKVAIDFAEKDQETLVIITTDHGNANPGIIYGKEANKNFDSLQIYKHSNEWILNSFNSNTTISQIKEVIEMSNGFAISEDDAKTILSYYTGLNKEDGIYNYKKLPYQALADIQKKTTSVGWISSDHSADFVELAAFGPGSELLKPFVKNTDLHYLMLQAAEVENKF